MPAKLDINTASKQQLTTLEGIDSEIADKIIGGRPYRSVIDLKERKILAEAVYDKIKDKVLIGIPFVPARRRPVQIAVP